MAGSVAVRCQTEMISPLYLVDKTRPRISPLGTSYYSPIIPSNKSSQNLAVCDLGVLIVQRPPFSQAGSSHKGYTPSMKKWRKVPSGMTDGRRKCEYTCQNSPIFKQLNISFKRWLRLIFTCHLLFRIEQLLCYLWYKSWTCPTGTLIVISAIIWPWPRLGNGARVALWPLASWTSLVLKAMLLPSWLSRLSAFYYILIK